VLRSSESQLGEEDTECLCLQAAESSETTHCSCLCFQLCEVWARTPARQRVERQLLFIIFTGHFVWMRAEHEYLLGYRVKSLEE